MISFIKKNAPVLLKGMLVALFWLFLWWMIAAVFDNALFIPSPVKVIVRLASLCGSVVFWKTVLISVARIILGLLLGITAAVALASLCALLPIESVTAPLLTVIKATPVASFIMLAWILLKRDSIPTFISALMITPIVFTNLLEGIKSVKKQYGAFAEVYRIKGIKRLKYIYIPGVLPQFSTGVIISAGIVWKAGVAAEVLCQPNFSIGAELFYAKNMLETTDVFAWTLVVIIISLIIEKTLKFLLKRVQK